MRAGAVLGAVLGAVHGGVWVVVRVVRGRLCLRAYPLWGVMVPVDVGDDVAVVVVVRVDVRLVEAVVVGDVVGVLRWHVSKVVSAYDAMAFFSMFNWNWHTPPDGA